MLYVSYPHPALAEFEEHAAIVVEGRSCHFNVFAKPATDCDRARDFLTKAGLSYESKDATTDTVITTIAGIQLEGFDEAAFRAALQSSGYPKTADPQHINAPMTVLLLVILMVYVTMVYGPIAAFLVELVPTRIRYSSMSLPYHIGNSWFGGSCRSSPPRLSSNRATSTTDCGIRSSLRVSRRSSAVG